MRLKATFAAAIAAAMAMPAAAAAADRYVDNSPALGDNANAPCTSPEAPCRTISFAVSQASPGDTVHVGGGLYYANVSLPGGVSLVGDDFHPGPLTDGEAVIDGLSGYAITAQPGNWRTVSRLTIRGGRAVGGASMWLKDGRVIVRENRFDEVADASRTQLDISDGSPKVIDNRFVGEQDGVDRRAIQYWGEGSPEFTGNTFISFPRGIQIHASSEGTPFVMVRGNDFSGMYNPGPYTSSAIELGSSAAYVVDNRLAAGSWESSFHGIDIGASPGTSDGATLRRNRVFGFTDAVSVAETQGSVSLAGDVLARNFRGLAVQGAGTDEVELDNVTVADSDSDIDILIHNAPLKLDSTTVGSGGISGVGSTCEIVHSNIEPNASQHAVHPSCKPEAFQHHVDPQFVAPTPELLNYHLGSSSPLLDRGNPQPAPGLVDVDREPFTVDGDCDGAARRDIGADERQVACPTGPDKPQTDPETPVVSDFKLGKLKRNRRRGTGRLKVRVTAPGRVRLAGARTLRPAKVEVAEAGVVSLPVRPRRAGQRRLAARGRLRVRLSVTFAPADGAGTPSTKVKRARLLRR